MILFDHTDLVEEFIGKIKKTKGKSRTSPHWLRTWGSGDVQNARVPFTKEAGDSVGLGTAARIVSLT